MRFTVATASLALLIAGAAHAAPGQSGLRGVVMRGPITPVCVAESPCTEPAKNVTLLFSRGGHLAGRAATDVYRMPVSIEKSERVKRPAKTRTRLGSSLLSIRPVVERRTE